MKRITYNAILDTYGEETYLIYEQIVGRIMIKEDWTIEAMRIAHYSPNLNVAQEIINTAKKHAIQEIAEANKYTPKITPKLTREEALLIILKRWRSNESRRNYRQCASITHITSLLRQEGYPMPSTIEDAADYFEECGYQILPVLTMNGFDTRWRCVCLFEGEN